MNIKETLDKLFALHTFGVKLGLKNIVSFLNEIGNPQSGLKTIHIAGSNGKGSTASFIASSLMEAGYKVGLYTSPHFVRFNERIRINGKEITDEAVAEFYAKHEKIILDKSLTFFEVTTAMAFQYFKNQKVDYAVIETGLGGRLDATNVLSPLAIVITSISQEHTNILGNSLSEIAFEKAGIIKNKSKVFIGKLPEEAAAVIEKKCSETDSELFAIDEYTNFSGGVIELYTEEIELDDWTMPLKGDYQKYNAALAGLVIAKIFNIDNQRIILQGIRNVIKNTNLQGRYEYFSTNPLVIFDSAHNPEGVENFLSEFKKEASAVKGNKILIFAAMRDKAVDKMLLMLNQQFDDIRITTVNYERALSIKELHHIAINQKINVNLEQQPVKFINDFIRFNKNDCLVVIGSMYLLGEIKSNLIK